MIDPDLAAARQCAPTGMNAAPDMWAALAENPESHPQGTPTRTMPAADPGDVIKSFVGTIQAIIATEHQRDQALATIARIEDLADWWDHLPAQAGIGPDAQRLRACAEQLRAALNPP